MIGDQAADLLQERARFSRRVDQLELVVEDGILATELASEGIDATELLLHSPSAQLLTREDEQRTERVGRPRWTRGSWMDSPDGAS